MKALKFANLLVIAAALTFAAAGCKKNPGYLTPLPPGMTQNPKDIGPGRVVPPSFAHDDDLIKEGLKEGFAANSPDSHVGWAEDASKFANETVHFAFDSSVVPTADKAKVRNVADFLQANPAAAVRVEGHCDERGTEEYNRALGERRALAVREELVLLGIAPSRVDTISYGKDRPVDPAHNEAAWRKNRRAEFILLTPPAK